MSKSFGKVLRALRGTKSQAEIAADLGLSKSAYAMYERGERTPRDEIKIRIAEYFDENLEDIFFRGEEKGVCQMDTLGANNLQIFNYEETPIRIIEQNGEPWWVLADVCRVLGITNHKNVSTRLDVDEKGVHQMDTLGGKQKMTTINESGLYKVILRSDKPEAKKFTRWVTHEVLPAIRKTGTYTVSPYKPKASSVGEVIKLIEATRSMMEEQGCEATDIAKAVKQICDQFNIVLPDFFVKPKELTLQDAMDMVDFIYAHERGRGKRKPTYEEFVEVQMTRKLMGGR